MRRDAVRNRRNLLEAAGETLRTEPGAVTMPVIAERADLSLGTAYRYFPSVDEVLKAYLLGVIVQLRNHSHDCTQTGPALFEEVVREWGPTTGKGGATKLKAMCGADALLDLHAVQDSRP
ncbi:TetR/AcrR family transcriptional regulator [Streptomyces luteogriseus]|uniref:TetR/AcrR family transcriptional regulator n=1 Tax=Streptomyces luteogriseus TaxID=68233 RepID=UPI003810C76C